jgi:membrane-bound lytic murein transglycosylase F
MLRKSYLSVLATAALIFLFSCSGGNNDGDQEPEFGSEPTVNIDLPEIMKRGKLTILAENSSTTYFIYKGKKMGFEYELLKLFAQHLGVELDVQIVHNLDSLQLLLNTGKGDIVACNYTVTKERAERINFSEPFLKTPQVLIQRSVQNDTDESFKSPAFIQDPSELAGKEVHVWKNSSYHERLMHLQEEIGDSIHIEGVSGNIGGEELIEMVSSGLIDYTVAEENIAAVNARFFDNINTSTTLSVKQKIAFGLRKNSPLLLQKLNEWLKETMKKPIFSYIQKKYFDSGQYAQQYINDNAKLDGRRISNFDEIFKKEAEAIGWDWRLIASIAYQESKFNPEIQGFGGAYGMMQFMPGTGPKYGVYPDSPPEVQIKGGAKKLQADDKSWSSIPDEVQRKKFALASYNAGKGHIVDAQRLARKHGMDPNKWDDNVEVMLLNLSKREYYQDEVVKNGMMKGTTTHHYVRSVYNRYLEWKEVYK